MSDFAEAVYTALSGDATFTGLVTGGVYLRKQMKRKGLSRDSYPAAYSNNRLLPVCIVRGRAQPPWGDIREGGALSVRQSVELWFHQDGDAGFTALENAADRAFTLLADRRLSGGIFTQYINQLGFFDPEQNNAASIRADYDAIGLRKG